MKEKIRHFIKVITGKYYKERIKELEKQLWEKDCENLILKQKLKDADNEIDRYKRSIEDIDIRHKKAINQLEDGYIEEINNIKNRYDKRISELDKESAKRLKKYETEKEEKKAAVKELKKANKTNAKQAVEITKLKEQNEFLKSHRRAPSLEELKSYTTGTKRKSTVVAS